MSVVGLDLFARSTFYHSQQKCITWENEKYQLDANDGLARAGLALAGCEAETKKVERMNSSPDFASDGNFEKVSLNSFTTR